MNLFRSDNDSVKITAIILAMAAYFGLTNLNSAKSAESFPAKEETSKTIQAAAPTDVAPNTMKLRVPKPVKKAKGSKDPKKPAVPLPPILAEIEAKYVKGSTLSARFNQVNEIASTKQKKTSAGVLLIKHPNQLRWETLTPDKNLLVSDGKTFWFYTPPFEAGERGQVIERRSSEVQSRLANLLLSGSFSSTQDMKLDQKSPTEFVLTPNKGTAGSVTLAQFQIDLDKKVIQKVSLEYEGGNHSEITLSEIEIGKALDPRYFSFVTPPETDRVKQ
ncbi:MAG: outer membrane lipoprotein chaperone LolA [Methylotenera sp.]|nr:outer membrane lipoprotein chaperone LolA [Oligoflexia bacterium]